MYVQQERERERDRERERERFKIKFVRFIKSPISNHYIKKKNLSLYYLFKSQVK